jgi:two-component system sensor histidine kinase VanS
LGQEQVLVSLAPERFDRLVANLIENAVRHNQTGGWLPVHTGLDGAGATVQVTNSGTPLDPAAHQASVVATARPGGGLIVGVTLRT